MVYRLLKLRAVFQGRINARHSPRRFAGPRPIVIPGKVVPLGDMPNGVCRCAHEPGKLYGPLIGNAVVASVSLRAQRRSENAAGEALQTVVSNEHDDPCLVIRLYIFGYRLVPDSVEVRLGRGRSPAAIGTRPLVLVQQRSPSVPCGKGFVVCRSDRQSRSPHLRSEKLEGIEAV
jgi:hypothetical protein